MDPGSRRGDGETRVSDPQSSMTLSLSKGGEGMETFFRLVGKGVG